VSRRWVAIGALSAAVAVAAGAFGAHALKARFGPDALAVWETAARYQMYHALALVALGPIAQAWRAPALRAAGWLFVAGTVLFSGSLYLLVLTGVRGLGAVTPAGGVALIAGWLCVAWGVARGR
jgi:uncharacterized membrane protein YgdD (TMEM256/DUF423 family)